MPDIVTLVESVDNGWNLLVGTAEDATSAEVSVPIVAEHYKAPMWRSHGNLPHSPHNRYAEAKSLTLLTYLPSPELTPGGLGRQ